MTSRGPSLVRLGLGKGAAQRAEALGWLTGGAPGPEIVDVLRQVRSGPDPAGTLERLLGLAEAAPSPLSPDRLRELGSLLGVSRALASLLTAHPTVLEEQPDLATAETPEQIHIVVRSRLARIAIDDLAGRASLPEIGAALADLADEVASHVLDLLGRTDSRMTVIAMGKWGGRELNYSSDIDVLFVADQPQLADRVARRFIAVLSEPTASGIAFRVDADLRPEGSRSPLTRNLDAYRSYYEQWAQPWEFQALIKARPAAGDRTLGEEFMAMIEPLVWPETMPVDAIATVRRLKARSEARASASEVKRSAGGLRDIEFACQLLQLVHGRFDPELRTPTTLTALELLGTHGYVRTDDVLDLASSYRFLRTVEHRLQLWDLRQTYEIPAAATERERVAKAIGFRDTPEAAALEQFENELAQRRRSVRTIHERLFYRPLLEAFAASPTVRLTPEGRTRQLAALGFRDQRGTERAFDELTAGLSRRSRLMQQLLPLMMEWLSESPNPDLGLHQLRLLVTASEDNTELVATLRDSPLAAERLCRLLGESRMVGSYLDRIPEFLPLLAEDSIEMATDADRGSAVERVRVRTEWDDRVASVRRFARRRILRTAAADMLSMVRYEEVAPTLTATADAAMEAALEVVRLEVGSDLPICVVAMGHWGGAELGYGSDLDLMYVYEGRASADPEAERQTANRIAALTGAVLSQPGAQPIAFAIDTDLRPEGKDGPLARNLEGFATYYQRWAEPWELQALIKSRPAAGDMALGERFIKMAAPHVWQHPVPVASVRAIRSMKARIERERVPAGEDPDFHLKLGQGALVDIEFTVQLLQLLGGGSATDTRGEDSSTQRRQVDPSLRLPGTVEAIGALVRFGLLTEAEGSALSEAHQFCGAVRNRLYLQAGRAANALPVDPEQATRLAASVGFDSRGELREEYRRLTRRARRVVQVRFYGME